MSTRGPSKGVTAAQLVGILAFTLALFFVVSFGTKTVEAYRLRSWRDRLQVDIAEMERERAVLRTEIERRESMAWVDKVLRASGYVPEGVMRIIITHAEATPTSDATMVQKLHETPSDATSVETTSTDLKPATAIALWAELFDGPHWQAWQRLIWGFDEDTESRYNGER
jgi:hypothetical protein